jgi:hypothetical protein
MKIERLGCGPKGQLYPNMKKLWAEPFVSSAEADSRRE